MNDYLRGIYKTRRQDTKVLGLHSNETRKDRTKVIENENLSSL